MRVSAIYLLFLGAVLSVVQATHAQSSLLYVSNLDESSGGSVPIAGDSFYAADFLTGSNPGGYTLDAVHVLMESVAGSPGAMTASIYTFDRQLNGRILATLDGPNPSTAGVYTYTASDLWLSPGYDYFVGLSAENPTAEGNYGWSASGTDEFHSEEGWLIGSVRLNSSNGSDWNIDHLHPLQFGIQATAVPEPSTLCLGVLGLGMLMAVRRRRRGGESDSYNSPLRV